MKRIAACLGMVLVMSGSRFIDSPLRAESSAALELSRFAEISRETQTLSADIALTWGPEGKIKRSFGTIRLMKPNLALINISGDYPLRMLASDGASRFMVEDARSYSKSDIDAQGGKVDSPWFGLPFRFFFTQSVNPFGPADRGEEIQSVAVEKKGTEVFHVIVAHGTHPMLYTARFYFSAKGVLQKSVVEFGAGATPSAVFTAELSNIRINSPMAPQSFRFIPAAGMKLKTESVADAMLAVGDLVPDFVLPSPDGKNISLSDERKNSKATLVNFWYLHCAPCMIEFPEFEKLYQQLHGTGLNVVAVDREDPPKAVSEYVHRAGLTFPIALGGPEQKHSVFDQYKVTVFPGTYLIDSEGHILYRYAGADINGLKRELAKLGFK